MNSGDYTKEDERIIIRSLQEENKMLRAMLARKGINAPESVAFSPLSRNNSLYESDQGGRIQFPFITEQMIRGYYAYFHGRDHCVRYKLPVMRTL